jgi:glyoxylase-like metal-dependent hydrolase (beta-lactamase superfamily II)
MATSKDIIRVDALYEGTFSVGLDKKFIRINKDDPPKKGSLKLSINPFLIRCRDKNILFDAGLGDFGEDTTTDIIKKNLEKFHLTEYDITDVFASHLHYDHIGGLAGKSNGFWELTFPDASVWVSRNEWEKLIHLDGATDDETKIDFIHFLDARADIQFLDEEDHPYPEIRVQEIGGHTEFSQVLFVDKGNHKYLMAGDVIGRKMAFQKKFKAKFDFDPDKALKKREELKKLAYEQNYTILAYHESESPIFNVTGYDPDQGYTTESIKDRAPA